MNSQRSHIDFLNDILGAIAKASEFVKGMDYTAFQADEKTQFAVVRALEIIGEATKKIPLDVRAEHPEVPWRERSGMRDKLIHDYISVNSEVVWKTTIEDLPSIEAPIFAMLKALDK